MKYSATVFALILSVAGFYASAQVSDNFSDGDFTNSPTWIGNTTVFEVSNNELRLNNASPASNNDSYLATNVSVVNNMVWEFYVKLDFNPSSTNQAFVYLFSDQSNLLGSLNGYYIGIGNTADEVSLYKQTGTTKTILINGTDGTVNVATPIVRVKVTRSASGEWKLYRDLTGGTTYLLEGSATDATHTSGSYFGFYCDYTSTRNTAFHFDDISIDQMRINSVTVISNTQLEVTFNQDLNQTTAETPSNYTLDGFTITSATRDATNQNKVTLTLDAGTPLTSGDHPLTIGTGLTQQSTTQKSFSYVQLGLSSVITLSSSSVRLTLNDDLNETIAETVGNYSVNSGIGTPTSATLNASNPKQVELAFAGSFADGVTYQLSLSNLQNASGNSVLSTSSNFNFVLPLILESATAVSGSTVLLTFNKTLDLTPSQQAANYTVNQGIGSASSAVRQDDQKSVLVTLPSSLSANTFTVTASNLLDAAGNLISATDKTASFSYVPLALASVAQQGSDAILVTFNQAVDQASAETSTNYSLSNGGAIASATWQSGAPTQVVLNSSGMANSTYSLSVSGVKNTNGNATASNLSANLDFSKATGFRALVINEVMADFTVPTGQTPTSYSGEYVELYNPGSVPIRLENFRLNNEKLPVYSLGAGAYVVVVDNSVYSAFSTLISNVIQVTNFDALSTPSDSVILRDQYRNLVDSISYKAEWFDDAVKDDGGYSLEQINPLLTCSENTNWTATTSTTGGTPGAQNSVYSQLADTSSPLVSSVTVSGSKELSVVFSEPMDVGTVGSGSFSLTGYTISSVRRTSYTTYTVALGADLVSEKTYQLGFSGIKDCEGNTLTTSSHTFYYDAKGPVLTDLIVIASDQVAVRFHERLQKTAADAEPNYRLNGLVPTSALLQDSSAQRVHLRFADPFTLGASYTLECTSLKDTLGNTTALSSAAFSFSEGIDSTYVLAGNLVLVYLKEKPVPATVSPDKFLISGSMGKPTSAWVDQEDSTLVYLSLGKNLNENTTYTLYTERLKSKTSGTWFITQASSLLYDTKAPTFVGLSILTDTVIKLTYDEPLDVQKAKASSLYSLENGANPISVVVSGSEITLTFRDKFQPEIEKRISIQKGISDRLGNTTASTRNVNFVYDPLPPRVVSCLYEGSGTFKITLNEKPDFSAISTHQFETSGTTSGIVNALGPDSVSLRVSFSSFAEALDSELTIKSLKDQAGNVATDTTLSINTLKPEVIGLKVKNDSTIFLTFNREMGNSLSLKENFTLNGKSVKSSIGTAKNVSLTVNRLLSGESYTLEYKNLSDASGNSLQSDSIEFLVDTYNETLKVLPSKTLELQFRTDFGSLASASFKLNNVSPLISQVDGADASIIRLVFQQAIPENESLTLQWKNLTDIYGRSIPDWTLTFLYDTKPPVVDTIVSDFFGVIEVAFDEPLELSGAKSITSYSIQNVGKPAEVTAKENTVILDFGSMLTVGTSYYLVVDGLSDLHGNYLAKDTLEFWYAPPALPTYKQIIFNEIMADPSPTVGLPEVEYLELLNASDESINLKTLRLKDPTTNIALPDYEVPAGGFVVLTTSSAVSQFSLANKIGLSGFPSLGNTTDSLVLVNQTGQVVDRVQYDQSWYKDTSKSDGGYTLELINPDTKCPTRDNWRASVEPAGGTPGKINSVYSQIADQTTPFVKSHVIAGGNSIVITFSESMDSLSLLSATYSVEELTIQEITINDLFIESLTVRFTQSIPSGKIYTLAVSGVQDCSGNPMASATLSFGNGRTPLFGELLITEIMADPDPVVQLTNSEYLELYNASADLISLSGLILTDATGTTSLPNQSIPAGGYAVLVPSASSVNFASFGQVIPISNWLSLNNTGETLALKNGNVLIDKVIYSSAWYGSSEKSDGGYSLELINPESKCPSGSNWTASTDSRGGTPGTRNSVFSLDPDTAAPIILLTESLSPSQLRITFSEPMDSLSLVSGSYSSSSLPVPTVIVEASLQSIVLAFDPTPPSGVVYSLTVSSISDCSGNELQSATVSFGSGRAPLFGELLITEIMADPDPVVQLPNSEYIEIFNASSDLISLGNVKYSDGLDTISLPSSILESGQFMILCPLSTMSLFEPYGTALGLPTWLSLTNAGERLSLFTQNERVFSITYSDDWHLEAEKRDGGYSLEMRDASNPCVENLNWGSSGDQKGGTPSQPNSIQESIPDNFGPNLTTIQVESAQAVVLVFDEALRPDSDVSITIVPEVGVSETSFLNSKSLSVSLTGTLDINVSYTLTIEGPVDCNGNPIETNSLEFVRPAIATAGEILLNELLSDPKTGGVDFVELVNISESHLSLQGWKLAREVDGEPDQLSEISLAPFSLKPGEYLALSVDSDQLALHFPKGKKEHFLEMTSFPTLPNEEGTVLLLDSSGIEMDRLEYTSEMHASLLQSTDGVSLERISLSLPTNDRNNWHSASSTVGFGTPGYANSQQFDTPAIQGVLAVEPRVFVPGGSAPGMQSFTTINYEFDQPGKFATVTVFDQNGRQVSTLASNASLSTSGFFQWDGTDQGGRAVRMGYYVVLFEVYDSTGKKDMIKETVVVGR